MRYLLDTNIVSDLVRNPQGQIADRIREVGEEPVCTSVCLIGSRQGGPLPPTPPALIDQGVNG